jgi:type I restriction enzyme, S subunit
VKWPLVPLCEIITFRGGGTPRKDNDEYWAKEIPWASVKDFKDIELEKTKDWISRIGLENSSANLIPAGHVIVPTRMALGKAAINSIDLAINQDLRALIPKVELDNRYLLHSFLGLAPEIERQGSGATVKGITQAKLGLMKIPLPPLEEQKRIAGILDAADILRAKRREALAKLDDLLQSTFLDMFGDPVTNPKGWEVKTFGETVEKMHQGINTAADKVRYVEVGAPIIQAKHIVADGISLEGVKFLGKSDREKYFSKYVPKQWDILFSNIGTIGRSSIFTETKELFFAWNVFGIRPNHTLVNVFYMKAFLDYLETVNFFDRYLTGGTVKFVSKKVLGSIMLPLPPLELQRRFAEIVSSVEEQKAKMRKHLEQLDDLFASLQQRAFRGDL